MAFAERAEDTLSISGEQTRQAEKQQSQGGIAWPVLCAAAWLLRYLSLYGPPWQSPPFWAGWFDQSHYLISTLAFTRGDLSASAHWYPLGYPLLATPFAWILPSDPFFLPDLLLFVATAIAFQQVVRDFGISAGTATLVFLASSLVQVPIAKVWLQPWNTTLSAAMLWWLVARTLAIFAATGSRALIARTRSMIVLGCLAGALPLVRPIDVSLSLICLGFALYGLWCRQQSVARSGCLLLAGALSSRPLDRT